MKVLVTCPPMIGRHDQWKSLLSEYEVVIPQFTQTMSEEEIISIIGEYDGWIAGDDPVTENVINHGDKLKVVIKWGIGIDNVDRDILSKRHIKFHNTPAMFGNEVADVAIGYLIGITRDLFRIDHEVKRGNWIKPAGISLIGKNACLVGFGDIGRNIARRLLALRMKVWVVDPGFTKTNGKIICNYVDMEIEDDLHQVNISDLDSCIYNSTVVILSCPLLDSTRHIINTRTLNLMNRGSYLINVSRGGLVVEKDVITCLESEQLKGFASDVFENEPLFPDNELLKYNVICGSHNASNTIDAVDKTNIRAINLLKNYI